MTDNNGSRAPGALPVADILRAARDFLQHEHSLFNTLGLKPLLVGAGAAKFSVDLPADFADASGSVHSGLLTIIIDSIMGLTVFTALETLKPIATVNLRTDVIARVAPGVRAVCACECLSVQNEIAFVEGRVTAESDGGLLMTGQGAFMVGSHRIVKGSRL